MKRWRRGEGKGEGSAPDGSEPGAVPAVPAGEPAAEAPPEAAEPAAPALPPLALPWPPLVNGVEGISLRPWGADPGDAAVLAAAWADPEIARWTKVPPAAGEADAARWIAGEEARRASGVAVDLVIGEYGNVANVYGEVGLVVVEPERRWAEVGYWLAPDARGAGRASIALGLFAAWALEDLALTRLFARTDPANPASAAVVQRAGFASVGTIDDGPQVWARDA